jgi:hypothetical protein
LLPMNEQVIERSFYRTSFVPPMLSESAIITIVLNCCAPNFF